MTVILLCGGYATRLYPLTLGGPKSLLVMDGRTLLDRILDDFRDWNSSWIHGSWIPGVDRVILVTSRRFYLQFDEWLKHTHPKVAIVCDGTHDDVDKLGAVADLSFALRSAVVVDDIMVIAPDNLFTQSLDGFVNVCKQETVPVVGTYDVERTERARNYGVVYRKAGRVTVVEKPDNPPATTVAVALYYYPVSYLTAIHSYVAAGKNLDAPGHLLAHFAQLGPIRTWPVPGLWFDIGSKEALDEATRRIV